MIIKANERLHVRHEILIVKYENVQVFLSLISSFVGNPVYTDQLQKAV